MKPDSILLFFLFFTFPMPGMFSKKTSLQKLLTGLKNEEQSLIKSLTNEKHPSKLRKTRKKPCYPITTCFNGKFITFKRKNGMCQNEPLIPNKGHVDIISYLYSILKH